MTTTDSKFWMWSFGADDGTAQQQLTVAYGAFHLRFHRAPRRVLVHETALRDGLQAPVGVNLETTTWQAERSFLFALDEETTRR